LKKAKIFINKNIDILNGSYQLFAIPLSCFYIILIRQVYCYRCQFHTSARSLFRSTFKTISLNNLVICLYKSYTLINSKIYYSSNRRRGISIISNPTQLEDQLGKDYLGIIPARGGSKRIFRKNLALLAGKPLIAYTIEAALKSLRLTRVIVSTDDSEIAELSLKYGAEVPILRPAELAQDQSTIPAVISHVLEIIGEEHPDIAGVVILQPTTPFRTGKHIDEAISLFEKSFADTVTAVYPADKHPFYAWTLSDDGKLTPFFSIKNQTMTRNELPIAFYENGSIYVINKAVLNSGTLYGEKIIPYPMKRFDSVDIDTPMDFLWAQFIMMNNSEPRYLEELNG
jgi:CMP-N,N'-diacetyllegionaminic acid synthase